MEKFCPICRLQYTGDQETCPVDGMRLFRKEDPLVGRLLNGRYRVMEKLSAGGMGAVYKVVEAHTGQVYAMKLLAPKFAGDRTQRERFFREARAARQIDHDNVIRVKEVDETADGLIVMVMEYLSGPTLAQLIATGPLSPKRTVRIGIQLARGLARAHDLGVIHRDIKPENVMFTSRKSRSDNIKLLDFGLASIKGDERITSTGQIFGTPEYISPEQASGKPTDHSSDLYALGVVLYEMVTGRLPFTGSAKQVMLAHVRTQPVAPKTVNPQWGIPPELDRAILHLLQKNKRDRFSDAHHLIEDLAAIDQQLNRHGGSTVRPGRPLSSSPSGGFSDQLSARLIDPYKARILKINEACAELPDRLLPVWLNDCFKKIAELTKEADQLNRLLQIDAHKRLRIDEDRAEHQHLLGQHVDEAAAEESRLKREIGIARHQLAALDSALSSLRLKREEVDPALVERRRTVQQAIDQTALLLDDVTYQLDQYRGRIGALTAVHDFDIRQTKIESASTTARFEEILVEFDQLTDRIERYLASVRGRS